MQRGQNNVTMARGFMGGCHYSCTGGIDNGNRHCLVCLTCMGLRSILCCQHTWVVVVGLFSGDGDCWHCKGGNGGGA